MRTWAIGIAAVLAAGCAAGGDDTMPDVRRDDGGEPDVPTGALVPASPPVEVFSSYDRTLGPVLLTTLSGSAAVIWGERDGSAGAWGEPGMAVVDGEGAVSTAAVHVALTGHEPAGLEPHTGLGQLAYFTVQREAACASTLYRSMLDTAGRITGVTATVDALDDALAVHTASIAGSAVVLAVEGGACTAREYPAARVIVVGASGPATASVPLGEAWRVSALTERPDGSGYLGIRDTHDGGLLIDTIGLGGGLSRSWTIVRRDGTCACPSSRAAIATGGTDYVAAWAGEVEGVQSWYLHPGPYEDDLPYGDDPVALPLEARFDRVVAVAAFQGAYVVAYVPASGGEALRIDLLATDGTLEAGWSPEVPGEVTAVAVAPIGARVAAAWVEKWDGASAPSVLRAGLFQRP